MWLQQMSFFARAIVSVLLTAASAGCVEPANPLEQQYERLTKLSEAEQAEQFRQLSPTDQVDVYLYGVENRRPSDYFLARYLERQESATVNVLIDRLHSSGSPVTTFALVYALHGVFTRGSQRVEKFGAVGASDACNRFYTAPSPCHQLAKDIDIRFPGN